MAGSFELLDGRRAVGDLTVKAFGADIPLVADPCPHGPGAERTSPRTPAGPAAAEEVMRFLHSCP